MEETPWWNTRIAEAIKKKNSAWREWYKDRIDEKKEKWKRLDKASKQMIRFAKKDSWNKFLKEIMENWKGDKKLIYKIIKNQRNQAQETSKILTKDGSLVWKKDEILNVWKDYFQNLLLGEEMVVSNQNKETLEEEMSLDRNIKEDDFTMLNLEIALDKMKNGKAPGEDEVTVEMTKSAGPIGMQWLYRLMRIVWKEGIIPKEWQKGIIIPIFKKGDKKDCKNYRGITLLSQCFKIYERIVYLKLINYIENNFQEEQHGFRPGRSTIDLIFTVRQLIEKRWEYNRDTIIAFLDISKAFDSVDRNKIWEALEKKKINKNMIVRIKNMYSSCINCVRVEDKKSNWFATTKGV